MAKILFLQDILFEFIGPMQLSAILKAKGHKTDLLVWTKEKDLIKKIKQIKPDLIAFSTTTGPHKEALKIARKIKSEINIPIIFGGAHPTLFPDVIKEDCVDMICIGEADLVILAIANAIDKKWNIKKIKNICVEEGKTIRKNELAPLVDLDNLPSIDRELYYKRYSFLKNLSVKKFITSRGCPYNCSFCFNQTMRKMYKGKGKWVRKRSVDRVIAEIKEVRKKYGLKGVRISDDTFTMEHTWLTEFLNKYKKEVNLPFTCLGRANEINEDIVKKLKHANCKVIFFGVEAGNEKLRNLVLNKRLTNKHIIEAARLLHKYKIKFGTYNMFCIPGETKKTAFETIELNAKIRPNYPYALIFQPYPRTEIANYAMERGFLDSSFTIDDINFMTGENKLKLKDKNEIINCQRLFTVGVKFPFMIPLIKILIKFKPNSIYKLIYDISFGWTRMMAFGSSIKESISLAIQMRNKV